MPIYEYKCKQCGTTSEFLIHHQELHDLECPTCGSKELNRLLSAPSLMRSETRMPGTTCCGREERCDTPPCSGGGGCHRR
jgi:putative FmdB family regulatory protein